MRTFSITAYLIFLYLWDIIFIFLIVTKPSVKYSIPNCSSCLRFVPFLKLPRQKHGKEHTMEVIINIQYYYEIYVSNPTDRIACFCIFFTYIDQ